MVREGPLEGVGDREGTAQVGRGEAAGPPGLPRAARRVGAHALYPHDTPGLRVSQLLWASGSPLREATGHENTETPLFHSPSEKFR